jgi:hypothetical protein
VTEDDLVIGILEQDAMGLTVAAGKRAGFAHSVILGRARPEGPEAEIAAGVRRGWNLPRLQPRDAWRERRLDEVDGFLAATPPSKVQHRQDESERE